MRAALLPLFVVLLGACGGGGSGGSPGAPVLGLGSLRLALTDAPACGYDKLFVTVQRVRVHGSASAGDSDAGWQELVLSPPRRFDLLALNNGVLAELGLLQLPAGRYQQLRLVLEPNGSGNPLANAVQPSGGVETALETPAALQSGLRLNADIEVRGNQQTDWAIDFDACRSVIKAGASGRYQLKPVLSLLALGSEAGLRVSGVLEGALGNGRAQVSLQQGGQVRRATPSDPSGRFLLYPVPAGSYELVVSAPGRASVVIEGVPVAAAQPTTLGSESQRLQLPPSAMQSVAGTVSVQGSVVSNGAAVRALQTLPAGPTVELAATNVDAGNGGYSLSLPTAAPQRVAYANGFNFQPVPSQAGRYRLEASAPGLSAKSVEIQLGNNPLVQNFSLP